MARQADAVPAGRLQAILTCVDGGSCRSRYMWPVPATGGFVEGVTLVETCKKHADHMENGRSRPRTLQMLNEQLNCKLLAINHHVMESKLVIRANRKTSNSHV